MRRLAPYLSIAAATIFMSLGVIMSVKTTSADSADSTNTESKNTETGVRARDRVASDADRDAIEATALDYIVGWYEGDAKRMESALYPELAKRVLMYDAASERGRLDHMGAMRLVQRTAARQDRATPTSDRQQDVEILDVFGNAASVKVVAADWIDYLHMSRINGEWKIVNVLWELKPEAKKRYGFPEGF